MNTPTFQIACHNCLGGCCSAGFAIFLTTLDVWRIRRGTRRTTYDLFKRDIVFAPGSQDPFLRCALRNETTKCPFLGVDSCLIHPDRPRVCRSYPVFVDGGQPGAVEKCGYNGPERISKTHTLTSWKIENGIKPADEEIDEIFNRFFFETLVPLDRKKLSVEVLRQIAFRLYHFDAWSEAGFPAAELGFDNPALVPRAFELAAEYVDRHLG